MLLKNKKKIYWLFFPFILFFCQTKASAEWSIVGSSFATENTHSDIVFSPVMAFNLVTSEPYVAYADRDYGGKMTVKKFNGFSWIDVGMRGFTEHYLDEDDIIFISFNPATNEPYVSYVDSTPVLPSVDVAMVKRFDGQSWVDVGVPKSISDGNVRWGGVALTFNPSTNEPYVAYRDATQNNKMTVKKFNGTNWSLIGSAGFSPPCLAPSLAFNPTTNQPYVAFQNTLDSYKVTVERFNGINWETVGNENLGLGNSDMTTNNQVIAFDKSTGIPYLMFFDYDNGSAPIAVKKLNDSSWIAVPSTPYGHPMSFTLNPTTNEPYVSYIGIDGTNNYKENVVKFNGSEWESVGSEFGIRSAYGSSLAFNPSTNEPYVAFHDIGAGNNTGGVVVMKYSSSDTAIPTAPPGLNVR